MNKALINIIRLIFVILFLYTGISKLLAYHDFVDESKQTASLIGISNSIILSVPFIEILIATLLTTRRWQLTGFYGSLVLMSAFTWYVIFLSRLQYYVPCDCGGGLDMLPINIHLLLNLILLTLTILGIFLMRWHKTISKKILRK